MRNIARISKGLTGFHIQHNGGNVVDVVGFKRLVMPLQYLVNLPLQSGPDAGFDPGIVIILTLAVGFKALQQVRSELWQGQMNSLLPSSQ